MRRFLRPAAAAALALLVACSGGDGDGSSSADGNALVVNSLLDSASPAAGTVTLASQAVPAAAPTAHDHAGVPPAKVVWAGTVSLTVTVAAVPPLLRTVMV